MKNLALLFIFVFSIPSISAEKENHKICNNFKGTGLDETVAQNFLDELKNMVEKEEYSKLAKKIKFPIKAKIDGKRISFKNEEVFLVFASKIFTKDYKNKILNSKPEDRVCRDSGVGLNHGAIWFMAPNWHEKPNEIRVIHFNN